MALMLGDPAGGLLAATGLVGIVAIGAGLRAQSSQRVHATAKMRAIEVLNQAPEFSQVNRERLLVLLSSNTPPLDRSDLIEASEAASGFDLGAALAQRVHSALPFDGDTDATIRFAYLVLEAGMHACNADADFKAEVASILLIHLVQTVSGFDDKLQTLINLSGDKARELHLTEQLFISLAKRYAKKVMDINQAHQELERAVEVASEEQAKSVLPASTDEAVAAILARVDELNNTGQIDEAAAHIVEEAAREVAGLARIYDKGIAQAILTRDVDVAFDYELKKIALETPRAAAQFGVLRRIQIAWCERGDVRGLNFDLEVSIALAHESYDRAKNAVQRAEALNGLGVALQTLGARESGADRLEKALSAYRAALEIYLRERRFYDWAMVQNNLGNALSTIGSREDGTDSLKKAVTAFQAALSLRSRERDEIEWAMTQHNLGIAFRNLGEREDGQNGIDLLEKSVAASRAALEVRTLKRGQIEWAMTQSNLGSALCNLGSKKQDCDHFEKAVVVHREILEALMQEDEPLIWATTQHNLGIGLRNLGELECGNERLDEAAIAYDSALKERTRQRVPLAWAITQDNLALLHFAYAGKPITVDRHVHLETALAHVEAALEVYDAEATALVHAQAIRLRDELRDRLSSDG